MPIFNCRYLIVMLVVMLPACNLGTEPPTPPATLEGGNSTVELIEDATNTPDALPTVTMLVRPVPISQTIAGLVWHDVCAVPEGEVSETPPGCVENDNGYSANGILEAGETGIAGVYVTLGEGACPSEGLAEAVTNDDGAYVFSDLESGTYCVTIDTLRPENLALLVPGAWRAPNDDGELTVTLTSGESKLNANFGWDFQFAP